MFKVKELVEQGQYSRAVKLLEQSDPVNVTPEVVNTLKELHPDSNKPMPAVSVHAPKVTVLDEKAFVKFFRTRVDRSSAGGCSGWTNQLVAPLLDDDVCLQGLMDLFILILNDNLSSKARTWLTASREMAFEKEKGKAGIRPIAMGEVFVRLVTAFQLSQCSDIAANAFMSVQVGVQVPGGSEVAIHLINSAATLLASTLDSKSKQPLVILKTDEKNAYNEIERANVARTFYDNQHAAPLHRLFHFLYNTPSNLFLYDNKGEMIQEAKLFSRQGVKQGDPISSLSFSMTVQPLYEKCLEARRHCMSIAVQDDFYIIGPCDEVFAAFNQFKNQAKSSNITVRNDKCAALVIRYHDQSSLSSNNLGIVRKLCRADSPSIKLLNDENKDYIECVGGVFSQNLSSISKWACDQIKKDSQFFDLLQEKVLPTQHASLLLRICGHPRFNFLSRVVPPQAFKAAAEMVDSKMSQVLATRLELKQPLSSSIKTQLSLPIKKSGFGLRSYEELSHVAYLSSFLQSAQHIYSNFASVYFSKAHVQPSSLPQHLKQDTIQAVLCGQDSDTNWLSKQLRNCFEVIQNNGIPVDNDVIHSSLENTLAHHSKHKISHLQRSLTEHAEKKKFDTFLKSKPIKESINQVRVNSCCNKSAGLWLTALPASSFSPATVLKDYQFVLAAKHRLGLPPTDVMMNKKCFCGSEIKSFDHFQNCLSIRNTKCTARHNMIVRHLTSIANRAGLCHSIGELRLSALPTSDDQKDKVPDAEIYNLTSSAPITFIDVSVVNTTASTYRSQLRPLSYRANHKNKLYSQICKDRGGEFRPFIVSSYGELGPDAEQLLKDIALVAHTERGLNYGLFLRQAKSEIAILLQQGNALIAKHGVRCLGHKFNPPQDDNNDLEF